MPAFQRGCMHGLALADMEDHPLLEGLTDSFAQTRCALLNRKEEQQVIQELLITNPSQNQNPIKY